MHTMRKYLIAGLALLTVSGTAFAADAADPKEKCCCCEKMKEDGKSCCPGEAEGDHKGHDMHGMHEMPTPPAPQK